jgi:diketogulonate reductase-like aldo/keto reductase
LLNQKELVEFCRNKGIVFQAYSSLGTSDKSLTKKLVENATVVSIAQKYSKSPAQVLLKWSLQQNIGKHRYSLSNNKFGYLLFLLKEYFFT